MGLDEGALVDLQDEGKGWASAPAQRSQVYRHRGIYLRPVQMMEVLTSVERLVDPVDRAVFVRLACIGVCVVLNYNWVWVLLNYKVVLVLDLLVLLSMEVLDLDFWREELQGIQALSTFVQANHPLGNLDILQVPLVDRSRREVAVDPGPDIPGIHGPIPGILGGFLEEGLLHLLHNCWGI